jgi:hypothetical protein
MGRRRATLLGIALVAAVTAAGCTRAGGTAAVRPEPPDRAAAPVVLESAGLRLPLDDYLLSPAALLAVTNAYRVLVGRCVVELGLPRPAATAAQQLTGPRTWTERRYGLTDPTAARTLGYHLGSREPARAKPASTQFTPAELAVVTGTGAATVHGRPVPAGGCATRAQQELAMHPAGVALQLPQQLSLTGFAQSRTDPQVRAATAAWSQCMRSAGLRYATPLDAAGAAASGHTPSAREIATATTDVGCKRRTNLIGIWFTAESAQQRTLIAAHATELAAVRAANETTLRLASQVTG